MHTTQLTLLGCGQNFTNRVIAAVSWEWVNPDRLVSRLQVLQVTLIGVRLKYQGKHLGSKLLQVCGTQRSLFFLLPWG